MGKRWMPVTAGVLDILCGASGVIIGILLLIFQPGYDPFHSQVYGIGRPLIITFGVLAIAGSVFAFKRMRWLLALSGAIAALIALFPIMWEYWWYLDPHIFFRGFFIDPYPCEAILFTIAGFSGIPAIVAIILTLLSRKQFERK